MRRKEYQKYVNIEKAKAKKEKKAKKKITGDGTFSFIKSKWGKSWGSYNLIDD